ncbi:MAG: hypothetical protein SVT52_04240 [Planctomycetota bacterium]|nr:hypothetical protein [Planctomycetota bacterium]
MALLIGEFEQTIDSKHRLAISSALREQLVPASDGENFILVLGPDGHLWLYPDLYFGQLLATLRRSPLPSRRSGKFILFFGTARLLKPDSQGRVVLPEKSMQRATVSDCVTLVGNDDHIEVWPRDEWERHVQEHMPSYGEVLYEAADRMNADHDNE